MILFPTFHAEQDVATLAQEYIQTGAIGNVIGIILFPVSHPVELADEFILARGVRDGKVAEVGVEAPVQRSFVWGEGLIRKLWLPLLLLCRGCPLSSPRWGLSTTPAWPSIHRVEESLANFFPELVVCVGRVDALQLTVPFHHAVSIHNIYLESPKPQCPPPLLIAVKALHSVHQAELIRQIVVVHLEVVLVRQVPSQKLKGNLLPQ